MKTSITIINDINVNLNELDVIDLYIKRMKNKLVKYFDHLALPV